MSDTPAPAPQSPVDQNKAQLDAITKSILSRASAPQAGGMPQPRPQFSPDSMQKQGFDTSHQVNRKADIGQSLGNIGTFIHNSVAQHKQNQIRDAVSEWEGFNHALEKAQVLAGDPSASDYQQKVQKMLGDDPWVKSNLDPANPKAVKRLKNMYKALNVDLLDGDAENVHREGLKRFFKVKDAYAKVKEAKDKLMGHQQQAKPQMDPAQQQAGMQQSLSKLMGQQTFKAPDVKAQNEAARTAVDAARVESDRYQFKQGVGSDGKTPTWYAFDSKDPSKAKEMTIDGKPVEVGFKASAAQGKPILVEGKPVAIMGPKGAVYPGQPGWDENMAKEYEAANKGWADAEAAKQRLAGIRAQTYLQSREYDALDTRTNTLVKIGPDKINAAPPGTYAPATGGVAALSKEAMFGDINYTITQMRDSAKKLKHGLTPQIRSQMIMALRSNDPAHSLATFASSEAMGSLPPDVVDYITSVATLQENAMVIRSLGNMGQGSQDLRDAILRTVPGAGTPDIAYLTQQLDKYQGVVDRLHKGVPKLGSSPQIITDPSQIKAPD